MNPDDYELPMDTTSADTEARRLIKELNDASSVLVDCVASAAAAEVGSLRTTDVVLALRLRGLEPSAEQLREFYATGAQLVSARAMLNGAQEEYNKAHYRVMRHLGGAR